VAGEIKTLPALQHLASLLGTPAHDRHVYRIFGPYAKLAPFQIRVQEQVEKGSLNSRGKAEYLSLNRALIAHMKEKGTFKRAGRLADQHHDEQLRRLLSETFRDLVTGRIEQPAVSDSC
jgi:hypothetical protein